MENGKAARNRSVPVSVVVPAFNRPGLLDVALQSVRSQTVSPDEIIVVDDGSTEGDIGAVARRHGAKLIRQDNAGVAAARNVGLAAATSPWVAFLDADDLWLPQKLELQYALLDESTDYGAVFSNFRILTSLGLFEETAFELNTAYRMIEKRPIAADSFELGMSSAGRALTRSMFVQPSCLLVDRALAMRIGGFDTSLKRCEDHEFALRVFAATRVIALENAVVRYRVGAGSLSKQELGMRVGALEVADRVLADPSRYPTGAVEVMNEIRPRLTRKAAASHIKLGDLLSARHLLGPSVRSQPQLKTVLMYAATLLGSHILPKRNVEFVLKLWRRIPFRKHRDWQSASPASLSVLSAADLAE